MSIFSLDLLVAATDLAPATANLSSLSIVSLDIVLGLFLSIFSLDLLVAVTELAPATVNLLSSSFFSFIISLLLLSIFLSAFVFNLDVDSTLLLSSNLLLVPFGRLLSSIEISDFMFSFNPFLLFEFDSNSLSFISNNSLIFSSGIPS